MGLKERLFSRTTKDNELFEIPQLDEALGGLNSAEQWSDLQGVILVFDIDGVLKHLGDNLRRLQPGWIDDRVIAYLKKLEDRGATIVIATNNPLSQHFISGCYARNRLLEELDRAHLFYSSTPFLWFLPRFQAKKNQDMVTYLAKFLNQIHDQQIRALIVVGDSPADDQFYEALKATILEEMEGAELKGEFIKMSSVFDAIPKTFRAFTPV